MFKYAFIGLFALSTWLAVPSTSFATDGAGDVIRVFYTARDASPVWTNKNRFSARARALPDIAQKLAIQNGLEPETYGIADMRALLETPPSDELGWQQAEILWSFNLWRLASDLNGEPLIAQDFKRLSDSNLERALNAFVPTAPLYKAMQAKLTELETAPEAPPIELLGNKIFRPGMQSSGVLPLRARMLEMGYLQSPPQTDDETLYDPSLVDAIKAFQADHALATDGQIGAATLSVINNSKDKQRIQLVANLQRLREPHRRLREDKRIEVSIARYHLDAYEDGKTVLSMPVIVGTARRQTISFRSEISGVRLNPTWSVPKTIKNEDYIPLLLSDPARLTNRYGVRVVKDGQQVDPTTVDWSQSTRSELASLRMWSPSGRNNPLGLYRVLMDNPYDIYLHDTNAPGLFGKGMRALSSGCIRVAQPDVLTDYILREKQGWSQDNTQETLRRGQTKDVIIENKIPIYLDYVTVWFNGSDQLVFGTDIYALDKPRYDGQVNKVLTTKQTRQKLLDQATAFLQVSPAQDGV